MKACPLRHMPQNWHRVITGLITAMFTRKGSWLLTTKQETQMIDIVLVTILSLRLEGEPCKGRHA